MKNKLYLDMVLDSCNFLLFDNNKNIIDQFNIKTNNDLIDKVIDLLNNFLEKNNLSYQDLNDLYINIGPGSFTGTKAIVNIAKTIKLVIKDINLYTITNDLVFNSGNGIALIDAKSNKFYVSVYKNLKEELKLSIVSKEQKEMIINKYFNMNVYDESNTNSIQRTKNIINILDLFQENNNFLELQPEYIKSALN